MITPTDFLAALMDGEHPHSLCAKAKDGKFHTVDLYKSADELLDVAAKRTAMGHDVWFGVHPVDELDGGRGGNADVVKVRCIVADLDWHDPSAHKDADLPAESTVRNVVAALEHKPTYIVATGHGLQAYWKLRYDVEPARGKDLTDRLHGWLARTGLKPERDDLASVLRVPGSINFKSEPVEVRLDGCRPEFAYTPDFLESRLPKLASTATRTSGRGKWRSLDRDALHEADRDALALLESVGGRSPFLLGNDSVSVTRPGRDKSDWETSASIGHHGPGRVHFFTPNWRPFKSGGTYDLRQLRELIEHVDNSDEAEAGRRTVKLTAASTVKVRPVHWLLDGRIPLGSFALLGGREGIGKSTLAYCYAAQITCGTMPDRYYGQRRAVVVAATEDSWEHTIVPRLMAAGADLDLVYRVDVTTSDGIDGTLTLPTDLIDLEQRAKEVGAALILLDPLLSRLSATLDTHKDAEVRVALEPLVTLADRCRAAVVGLIHVNKGGGTDPLTLIMASRAFVAVARAVLFVMNDPDEDNTRLLGQPKNNLGRTDLPILKFTIEGVKVADTEEGEVWTGRLVWSGETDRSIASYLEEGAAGGEQRTAVGEAAAWLHDYLLTQGGRARSKDCKDVGGKAGHTHDALKRACKKLKVETEAEGFPRITWWSLPQLAQLAGETSPTHSTQPTGRDLHQQKAQLAESTELADSPGATLQLVAPTAVCEQCSTLDAPISWSGRAQQMLCRDCWPDAPTTTESENF